MVLEISSVISSRKWRYLFLFVSNLEFDDSVYLNPRKEKQLPMTVDNTIVMVYERKNKVCASFMDFVGRVLALQGNSPVHKFSLKFEDSNEPVDPNRVFSWILNVLQRLLRLLKNSESNQKVGWESLPRLRKNSPNLETLVLQV